MNWYRHPPVCSSVWGDNPLYLDCGLSTIEADLLWHKDVNNTNTETTAALKKNSHRNILIVSSKLPC